MALSLSPMYKKIFYEKLLITEKQVTIGRVKRSVFWPVFLSAFLLLAGLVFLAIKGNIALAAEFPTPFTITADFFEIRNSTIVLGTSLADNHLPVAITTDSATATNLRITKQVNIPLVGEVQFTLRAATGNSSARLFGTRTDVESLRAPLAKLTNVVTSTNARFGVKLTADDQKLFNVTIKTPYLSVDSATFPDLSLTVTKVN